MVYPKKYKQIYHHLLVLILPLLLGGTLSGQTVKINKLKRKLVATITNSAKDSLDQLQVIEKRLTTEIKQKETEIAFLNLLETS